jgi:hypothetical protein
MEAFAYPGVVLILGLVAMFMFKRPLANLLGRAHKLSLTGLEASVSPQQTAIESTARSAKAATNTFDDFQQAMNQFRFPTAARKVEEFKRQVDLESISREQLITMVTDSAAMIMVAIDFENIYNLIFGSQLTLLSDLNTVFAAGRPIARARAFYDRAAAESSEIYESFPFEQWCGFLRQSRLITLEQGGIIKITEEGRDFLRYIVQVGKPAMKSF